MSADWRPTDSPSPFFVRHADALYEACAEAIQAGRIDARSKIGDATLDYRQERDEMAERQASLRGRAGEPSDLSPRGPSGDSVPFPLTNTVEDEERASWADREPDDPAS